jgi:hypothetical protein
MNNQNEFANVLRGGRVAPPADHRSTLDDLDKALNQSQVLEERGRFFHEASGLSFEIYRMNLKGYDATDARTFSVDADAARAAGMNPGEANAIAECKAFLMHAVRLGGAAIDEERAYKIAAREGWGTDKLRLITECKAHNPRPGDPVELANMLFASQQWLALTLDYLLETQTIKDAMREISMSESEAGALLERQREVRAVMQLRQFAQKLDLPFIDALHARAAQIEAETASVN